MKRTLVHGALLLLASGAGAQDAQRGKVLYRQLPGEPGVGSCISCHGDPVNNRNSVLRGGSGGAWISRTIAAVGAMGYLRQYLSEADLADIAAYLATVAPAGAVELLPATWPASDDFGAQQLGVASPPRQILLRNLQTRGDISIGALQADDAQALALQHDCPLSLPPNGQCAITLRWRPQALGPFSSGFRVLAPDGRLLRSGLLAGQGMGEALPQLAWVMPPAQNLLDFGRVGLGSARSLGLQLHNPGPQAVRLSRLRATGADAARFSLEADCLQRGRLEAGERCDIQLRYQPTSAGRSEAWLEMSAEAGHAPTLRLSGLGETAAEPAPAPPPAPAPAPSSGGGSSHGGWLLALLAATLRLRRR